MIPASFRYHRPKSVPAAIRLLQQHGPDAKVLAGGQSLLPLMKMRVSAPQHLIDVTRIPVLARVRFVDGLLRVGATATHRTIEASSVVRRRAPVLAETAAAIGDLQVRNLGTVGGSLAHADPASDYPAAVLALDAEMIVAGPSGERAVPASEFFRGIMTTAVGPGEMLTEVRISEAGDGSGQAYLKMANPASGFALTGVAATVAVDSHGRCTLARIGITGVASVAFRASAVEQALMGQMLTDDVIERAAAVADAGVDAIDDLHAGAEYRRRLARVLTRRAVGVARDRAQQRSAKSASAPRARPDVRDEDRPQAARP
jgi:carbon-monoxide dehydrogenase medium subunit